MRSYTPERKVFTMSKIGILGGRDSVLGFLSIGFVAMPVKDEHEARHALHRLAAEDCAVIFVTEEYAAPLAEDIAKYKDSPTPAVVVIPGAGGSRGLGMEALRAASERAIGADILFKEE